MSVHAEAGSNPLVPSIPPAQRVFSRMPNIRQQKKRVRTAERQHAENVRYRSTVRTLTRKLRDVAAEGDKDAVQAATVISCGGSTAPSRAVRCTGTPPPAARRRRAKLVAADSSVIPAAYHCSLDPPNG